GLTIGLMSLDETNLRVLQRSDQPKQREYAAIIGPIRNRGHLLLCTLLIANTIINETLPIVIDSLFGNGWQAVLVSSALIVIFGEILPQAVCSRYGLYIGAKMAWFVKGLIWILFIISYPISKVLDFMLGENHGVIYRRSELKELVSILGDKAHGSSLMTDEVNIIKGVLDLRDKFAADAMTPLKDAFMLDACTFINKDTLNKVHEALLLKQIVSHGYSRIPVYEGNPNNILGMILVKRMITLTPNDKIMIKDLPLNHLHRVTKTKPLFDMIHEFEKGQSHMAVVCDENGASIGIITLEDVIEE
ncbi:DUF21-domain-containing protein, partial [Rozella allomycis CSF55]